MPRGSSSVSSAQEESQDVLAVFIRLLESRGGLSSNGARAAPMLAPNVFKEYNIAGGILLRNFYTLRGASLNDQTV